MKYCYNFYDISNLSDITVKFDKKEDFVESLLSRLHARTKILSVYIEEEHEKPIDMKKCPCEKYVDIFYPDGTLIVHTNNRLVYDWVRLQIKEKQLIGCYLMFQGQRISLDRNGTEGDYPEGLMDEGTKVLLQLV